MACCPCSRKYAVKKSPAPVLLLAQRSLGGLLPLQPQVRRHEQPSSGPIADPAQPERPVAPAAASTQSRTAQPSSGLIAGPAQPGWPAAPAAASTPS
eukprot:365637-Chlamydomonas_euryale.AAC.2